MEEETASIARLLKGIDRYNPENLVILERYVEMQVKENFYDLEANLAVLKLYQFNPAHFRLQTVALILMKALTNLPHTDFTLCKCLLDPLKLEEPQIVKILQLGNMLELCHFRQFWATLGEEPSTVMGVVGFEDSIRKFICHVIGISYQTINREDLSELLGSISDPKVDQWISKQGWKDNGDGFVFVANQEDTIKPKNIQEKITFDTVAGIMSNLGTSH